MRRAITSAVLAAGLGAAAFASAAEIGKASKGLAQAMKGRNLQAVMSSLSADFQKVGEEGKKQTREQYGQSLQRFFGNIQQIVRVDRRLGQVNMKGGEAVVDVTTEMQALVHDHEGAYGPAGKTTLIDIKGVDREIWKKQGAVWRMRSSATLSRVRPAASKTPPARE